MSKTSNQHRFRKLTNQIEATTSRAMICQICLFADVRESLKFEPVSFLCLCIHAGANACDHGREHVHLSVCGSVSGIFVRLNLGESSLVVKAVYTNKGGDSGVINA